MLRYKERVESSDSPCFVTSSVFALGAKDK